MTEIVDMVMGKEGMTTLCTREPIHIDHLLRIVSGLRKAYLSPVSPIPPEPKEMFQEEACNT